MTDLELLEEVVAAGRQRVCSAVIGSGLGHAVRLLEDVVLLGRSGAQMPVTRSEMKRFLRNHVRDARIRSGHR